MSGKCFRAAFIVVLLYSLFTLLRLLHSGGDISRFITAGDFFVNAKKTPSLISVQPHSVGYDGEFFYRLALNPLTDQLQANGVRFDNAAFRQQRIGYPLLTWLFAAGQPVLVPWMLVVVNLLALAGVAFLGAQLAVRAGKNALWGCLFALYPGFSVSYHRDLAEIVTAFWVLLSLISVDRQRYFAAAIAFCAALFTRETSLLIAAGAGFYLMQRFIERRDIKKYPWPWMLAPLLSYLSWNYFLQVRWQQPPTSGGLQDIGVPFDGIIEFLSLNLSRFSLLGAANIIYFTFCAAALIAAATALRRSKISVNVKYSWLLYTALILSLSSVIWLSFAEFLRAFSELYLLSLMVLLGVQLRPATTKLIVVSVLAGWVALQLLYSASGA